MAPLGPDFRSISRVDYKGLLCPAAPPPIGSAATSPPPAGPKDGGKPGRTIVRRSGKRRLAGLYRAREVVSVLPSEGESLHGVLFGFFDLAHLLVALLDKLACPCLHLRIATLSFSKRNVAELAGLLDRGTVRRLDLLTSDFQKNHDPEILSGALAELVTARSQRVGAARSHCKLILMDMGAEKWTLEGSGNLRTSRNAEQFTLCRDSTVHDFYAEWFDSTLAAHLITGA